MSTIVAPDVLGSVAADPKIQAMFEGLVVSALTAAGGKPVLLADLMVQFAVAVRSDLAPAVMRAQQWYAVYNSREGADGTVNLPSRRFSGRALELLEPLVDDFNRLLARLASDDFRVVRLQGSWVHRGDRFGEK